MIHCVRCNKELDKPIHFDRRGNGPFCFNCYHDRRNELDDPAFRVAEEYERIYAPKLAAKDSEIARLRAALERMSNRALYGSRWDESIYFSVDDTDTEEVHPAEFARKALDNK